MSVPCLFWPVTVTTSQMVFRLERNPTGVPGNTTTNTTVTAGTYVNPDGTSSLLTQVETDFGTVNGVSVALSLSVDGVVTITVSGIESPSGARIHWNNSSATQALGAALGFDTSAADVPDSTGASSATFVATKAMPRYWTPGLAPRRDDPGTEQEIVVTRALSGVSTYDKIAAQDYRLIAFDWLSPERVFIASESGTTTNAALERFITDDAAPGKFRWFDDRSTLGSGYADYFLAAESVTKFEPKRLNEAVALYSYDLKLWEYVS